MNPNESHIADTGKMVMLPIKDLHPHPDNPRKELGDLAELADSIKANGVFQNLTVVKAEKGYTVIMGHRRRAASEIAGLTHLPCVIVEMTPMEQLQTMLLENMQRSDLTAYEQAQGFQLMIDMGDTVDGIVEKTGFSKTTVKRRLKMAELDATTLREVSSRQISIGDFDRLAAIEDLAERNECLRHIGTANFAMEAEKRIKKQNIAKNLPAVRSALKSAKAKGIKQSDTWYGKYTEIRGSEVAIDKLTEDGAIIPECNEKLYYYLDESTGRLRFYTEAKKAPPVKRPQEEIDREKACKEANEKCLEISALSQKLREEFVKTLVLNSRNRDAMLNGAASAIMSLAFKYGSPSSTAMYDTAGIERKWAPGENEQVVAALQKCSERSYPTIIYAAFCDSNEYYHSTYKQQWPVHTKNLRLDLLYAWLTSVGYVMSDDEKGMQDGTHELFKDPKKVEETA